MGNDPLRVLLIEDNPGDADLIQEMAAESNHIPLRFAVAERLSTATELLGEESFDIVLLDLSLPDSHGLETLSRIGGAAAGMPVIVLTGLDDEETAVLAAQMGAQDYLVKGRIDGPMLTRSIRYALERHQLVGALEDVTLREQETDGSRSIERLSRLWDAGPTAGADGSSVPGGTRPLAESDAEARSGWTQRWSMLLDTAMDRRGLETEPEARDGLRAIAEEIGRRGGQPSDVVDVHVAALRESQGRAPATSHEAYAREAGWMLIETLGHLAAFYQAAAGAAEAREPAPVASR